MRHLRWLLIAPIAAAAACGPSPAQKLLAKCAAASGIDKDPGAYELKGTIREAGADQGCDLVFKGAALRATISGLLPSIGTYDGERTWVKSGAISHTMIKGSGEPDLILDWVASGAWAADPSPVDVELADGDPSHTTVHLKPKDGFTKATLTLTRTCSPSGWT